MQLNFLSGLLHVYLAVVLVVNLLEMSFEDLMRTQFGDPAVEVEGIVMAWRLRTSLAGLSHLGQATPGVSDKFGMGLKLA